MARIDYYYIQELFVTLLEDAFADTITYEIEPENIAAEQCPFVGIYLPSREPFEPQPIAAGTIQRYTITMELWCWEANLDKKLAFEHRDDLIGNVEIALMEVRTAKGLGQYGFRLLGGEFENARDKLGNYLAGGSIIVELEASATT